MSTSKQIRALRTAILEGSETAIEEAVEAICQTLRDAPESLDDLDFSILKEMRDERQFTALRNLASCCLSAGLNHPSIRLLLMQALIEDGELSIAIDIGRLMLSMTDLPIEIKVEASGLIGRSFKDLFLSFASNESDRRSELLRQSIRYYQMSFESSGNGSIWAAENLVVMLSAAGDATENSVPDSELLKDRFQKLLKKVPTKNRSYWDWAGFAILHASNRDWSSAADAMRQAMDNTDVSAFQVAGTLRQLQTLVDLEGGGETLIVPLQAKLLQLSQGRIELTSAQLQSARSVPPSHYEKVLGDRGPLAHAWLLQFLNAGSSVGLISKKLGRGMGTCFLISGDDIHPKLAGERLAITNDHVVSEHPEEYRSNPPLRPDKAVVSFETEGSTQYPIREIVWSSGVDFHDACLIRLEGALPDDLLPLQIGAYAPELDATAPGEVFVIGHPGGLGLSYSMQNNDLIDHDCTEAAKANPAYIHYFTPTEHGSSGSPAFNEDLDVIGLHHAGGKYMSKLKGQDGTYPANEAVWIQSIVKAIAQSFEAGEKRWSA